MAGVINDYDALRKFRRELLDTVDDLRVQLSNTERAMSDVAAVWKDAQFSKYEEEFTKDKERIEPLCKDLEDFEAGVLYPLEQLIRRYLGL